MSLFFFGFSGSGYELIPIRRGIVVTAEPRTHRHRKKFPLDQHRYGWTCREWRRAAFSQDPLLGVTFVLESIGKRWYRCSDLYREFGIISSIPDSES
jgi:hypothetical protein